MSYFDTEEDLKHGDSTKCCEWGFLDIYLALIIIYLKKYIIFSQYLKLSVSCLHSDLTK